MSEKRETVVCPLSMFSTYLRECQHNVEKKYSTYTDVTKCPFGDVDINGKVFCILTALVRSNS